MEADFADFFRHAYPKTVVVLCQMGFSLAAAEDAAAEAMTSLLTTSVEITNPLAWAMKTAIRHASRAARRDRLGRQKAELAARRDRRDVEEIDTDRLNELDEVALGLLRRLTPVRRQVITLYYQGFETYEIAEILEIKEATIRSHRRHAKKQFAGFADELHAEVRGEFEEFFTLLLTEEVTTDDQQLRDLGRFRCR
ncbi:sigma-70 family RNA polymerase sigma factor [Actinokineospora sp. PR83]|uniref:sigma-70 family RNA polymerase sigma factor n=1 Tax=Actinokineospora sp. PR83 TaxID=2884908 RepID=UPI0027E20B33|nr:sigma-70 family RNA polymerase sigma factor [Actinokineospora sp. PR83]MCG8919438.1 sigma-70 family RNA polymerase sigma factor [Actinokineospora sp. PR83]